MIAQLLAEGARRVLLLAPKPLLGQWRQELFQLFDIQAREGLPRASGFEGDGVFLMGREAAGSEKGRDALLTSEPFDLCVIDEAHEVFAGLYRRFDKLGDYKDDVPLARTAGRVFDVLTASRTPVLLLTATPIQNSLTELWALVRFVDPLGTLLGDLPTFREVFCAGDDRRLAPGQDLELRERLRTVLQRTLRRQAQTFLEKPFVDRQARLFDYAMSPAERALYDDVTRYLLEPGIQAFQGKQRQLLLLGFHRRLASSTRALAASLEGVVRRLRRLGSGAPTDPSQEDAEVSETLEDLEGEDLEASDDPEVDDSTKPRVYDREAVQSELQRVEGFVARARALGGDDSKFRCLLRALQFVKEREKVGQGAGKLVIFTESLVTQEYLREKLIESRLVADEDITLFRGNNDSKRAHQALERWRQEVPQDEGGTPSPDIAVRLALVHEFKTRSRVFISTEAGGKGLNLQFCNALVNYDLPWNPQRIEQRIGRCHRYGQQHAVTVINFIARDNEAQALTFDILSQKLELFGTVLDASDQVLHRSDDATTGALVSSLGAELEAELKRIYDRASTLEEVTTRLRELRDRVVEERARFEETHSRTAGLIEDRLDEGVQRVFRLRKDALPLALAELDADLRTVVLAYLDANGISHELAVLPNAELLRVKPSPALPEGLREGLSAAIGASKEHTSLHLGHPLVVAAVADARAAGAAFSATVELPEDAPEELRKHRGRRARLRLMKLSFDGFEQEELLVPVVAVVGGELLEPRVAEAIFGCRFRDDQRGGPSGISDAVIDDATEEVLFNVQSTVDGAEQRRFERASVQAESYIEDRLLVLKKRRAALQERLEQALLRRDGATGAAARTEHEQSVLSGQTSLEEVDAAVERLEQRDDDVFRSYRDHIQKRRYAPPRVERLFDVDLVIE